ncbi:MAG: hypothetical protein AAGM40_30130, partial [Cyanobacteria bacterium J06573_2]
PSEFIIFNPLLINCNSEGLINDKSRLWSRIANFLIKVRMGESINSAARKSGISMRLVNRLIELGNLRGRGQGVGKPLRCGGSLRCSKWRNP